MFEAGDDLCNDCFHKMLEEDAAGETPMVGPFVRVPVPDANTQLCDGCGNQLELVKLHLSAGKTHMKVPLHRATSMLVYGHRTGDAYMSSHLEANEYAGCPNCNWLLTPEDIRGWSK